MPLILTRAVRGRPEERPTVVGKYSTLSEAAQALAATLKAYPEYGSDPALLCWWAKDKLGRTYEFEAMRELSTRR